MKAQELIEKYVKKKYQNKASVIALLKNDNWYHVHLDEQIPKKHTPMISIKEDENKTKKK